VTCYFDVVLCPCSSQILASLAWVSKVTPSKNPAVKFSSKFAAKYLLKIPPHLICVATQYLVEH